MQRPQRLLALLVALQANRQMTAEQLAEQFTVSKRTILRDVDALIAADVPIVAERGRYGGISLLPGAAVDVGRLTDSEAEVLEVIGVDLSRARRLGIEVAARSAAQKLAARRPRPQPRRQEELLPLGEVVTIDDTAWFAASDTPGIAALTHDIRLGRRLRIEYRSSGERRATARIVDPYGLFSRAGRWYLIADSDGHPRMFATVRLVSWTVLDDKRHLRPGITLADIVHELTAALEQRRDVIVTALLDADREDIARRILGSRLLSVAPVDHTGQVRISVGYDQLDGVRQLLQFSDHIEIIDPPEARDLIAHLANIIAERHRRNSA
ncbi:helix-turn-helix transcriptional regulator [Nocardia sp. 004]|uniref:helix-turn-helix transcriptional regulator n=1 Tax=Nocardia sp. 004 TaxID=3385978 RepID=UPI00399F741A